MLKMKKQEESMIESKEIRKQYLGRVEELEKIKALATLPNTDLMTTKAVADWFEVDNKTIQKTFERNKDELTSNGVKFMKYREIKDLVKTDNMSALRISRAGTNVYTKRAVLNIGMLLRDSNVAKQLRKNILDVYEAAPDEIKTFPIEHEQQMLLNIFYAKDDTEKAIAIADFNQLKNQHINKLEQVITSQEPKVKIHDQLVASINLADMIITAKNVGVGEKKLFEFLRATKVLFKKGGYNYPYQYYQDKEYFKVKTRVREDSLGRVTSHDTTKVTGKGKVFITQLVDKYGGAEKINSLKLKEIKSYVTNFKDKK